MMRYASDNFKEQEKRIQEKREYIEQKRRLLAEKGIEIHEIKVEKPKYKKNDKGAEPGSMWDMMQYMDRKFREEKDYLERQEKALDEVIKKIEAGKYKAPVDHDKIYAEKKRIVKE